MHFSWDSVICEQVLKMMMLFCPFVKQFHIRFSVLTKIRSFNEGLESGLDCFHLLHSNEPFFRKKFKSHSPQITLFM